MILTSTDRVLTPTWGSKSESLGLEILLSIYFLLIQLDYIIAARGILFYLLLGSINAIGLVFFVLMMLKHRNYRILFFLVIIFLSGLLSSRYNANYDIVYYLSMFRYAGISLYLLYKPRNRRIMTILMYVTLLLFLPVFVNPYGFTIFTKVSRNYHSVVLLAVNFVYNLSFIERCEKIRYMPTVVSFLVSLFAQGRGGIITYTIFFLAIIVYNNQVAKLKLNLRARRRLSFSVFQVMLFLVFLSFLFVNIIITIVIPDIEDVGGVTNEWDSRFSVQSEIGFSGKGFESKARVKLFQLYLNSTKSDLSKLMLGVPLGSAKYFSRFKYNLHNSYLAFHSGFGLLGFLLLSILVVRTFQKIAKTKNWGLGLMFFAVCVRILVDDAALLGSLDVILLLFLFQPFFRKSDHILHNNFSLERS